jgi:hypothetical protein
VKTLLKSLAAAAISGAVTGITAANVDGSASPKAVGAIALAGAVMGVLHYLTASPLAAR